ncbi:hypothetical protein RchiOBHm_Chr7g0196991 [Rosa chinensis]|uniref:Uncharacterized protein n=1 Tax=Rosa chinensis TaxID=74649 RepID=A0A2P6P6U7_ROSCH|nr:hypothetical protein RchiOBHm_Chr7g0196991 [Rosa chinensis]
MAVQFAIQCSMRRYALKVIVSSSCKLLTLKMKMLGCWIMSLMRFEFCLASIIIFLFPM